MQERAVVKERGHNLFYGLLISVLTFLLFGSGGGEHQSNSVIPFLEPFKIAHFYNNAIGIGL